MKNTNEYEAFDQLVRAVVKVPHSEIKEKLDAEKEAKKAKKLTKKKEGRL